MTDYNYEYVRKSSPAERASTAKRGKQLLAQYGTQINKYRGGMPAGFAAAIMAIESNGNPNLVGDVSLGEHGLYQVAAYIPPIFGFKAEARLNPEDNIFLGMMEYQTEVVKWKLAYPALIDMGSADAWKLARLTFAIGGTARTVLAPLAKPTEFGKVYDAIYNYVERNGGVPLGSQSAEKVKYRVKMIQVQWEIGQAVAAGAPTVPLFVPNPPAGPYRLKEEWFAQFSKPAPLGLLAAIAAGVMAMYLAWKKPKKTLT